MTLLPKKSLPKECADVRPINLGSVASQLFARLLLNRTEKAILPQRSEQCARKGRQTCDCIFSVTRGLDFSREWRIPGVWLKIDLAKAFNKVCRSRMMSNSRHSLGTHKNGAVDTPYFRIPMLSFSLLGDVVGSLFGLEFVREVLNHLLSL